MYDRNTRSAFADIGLENDGPAQAGSVDEIECLLRIARERPLRYCTRGRESAQDCGFRFPGETAGVDARICRRKTR